MEDQDPRVTVLRSKFVLSIDREDRGLYGTIKAQYPHALEEP